MNINFLIYLYIFFNIIFDQKENKVEKFIEID